MPLEPDPVPKEIFKHIEKVSTQKPIDLDLHELPGGSHLYLGGGRVVVVVGIALVIFICLIALVLLVNFGPDLSGGIGSIFGVDQPTITPAPKPDHFNQFILNSSGHDPVLTDQKRFFNIPFLNVGEKTLTDAKKSGSPIFVVISETRKRSETTNLGTVFFTEYSAAVFNTDNNDLPYSLQLPLPDYSDFKVYYTLANSETDAINLQKDMCYYADLLSFQKAGACLR